MHADDNSAPHGDNNAIFSSDSGSLLATLTPVQKGSVVVLAVSLALVSWAGYARAVQYSTSVSNVNAQDIVVESSEALNLEVLSPDQPKTTVTTPSVSNVASDDVTVRYESTQTSTGSSSDSSASLTVNGQQVPVSQSGTKKVIKSRTSGSNSTVVINVDNQSSSSGQSGGGD
jgi:hypothetical protein